MSEDKDLKLKNFLKQNESAVPQPVKEEWSTILQKTTEPSKTFDFHFWKLGLATVAIAVFAIVMTPKKTTQVAFDAEEMTAIMLDTYDYIDDITVEPDDYLE